MATSKQLNFSSLGGGGGSDDTSPSSPLSRRKSPRKLAPKRTTAAEEEEARKKKRKLASPVTKRIWNEDDELAVLKGLVDYRAKTGLQPSIDWDAFLSFVEGSINGEVSKDQLLSKIRKLKRKFRTNMEKINEGKDPLFTRSTDSEAFGFSMMIWGKIEPEIPNEQSKNGEETFKEDEEAADAEPLNGNDPGKSDFDGRSCHEVVITENGEDGKESHDEDDDDDELGAVQDAFETLMWQGLTDYQKKLQLEKVMNLGAEKRKELSHEWKELCAEDGKLIIKKLSFFTKLAEAANIK